MLQIRKIARCFLPIVLLIGSQPAHALISQESIAQHLRHPTFEQRVQLIRGTGPKGLEGLRAIAFDSKTPERIKWNAIISMGVVYGDKAQGDLERALRSDEWILRNSALIALRSFNPGLSKDWSIKLLNDKALVVRSSSVESLSKNLDDQTIASLWEALNDPKNFRGNRSLWIRKQIVNAVAARPRESDAARFINILKDKDQNLHPLAVKALERITGLRKGDSESTVQEQSQLWLSWWSSQKI
ncbi:MAG: HEAT repeat domain-containing protein [Bdellovibrionales bacterium]|nr:HEAT repeat domain-containing protein [Bdellovibrionales bacterium]